MAAFLPLYQRSLHEIRGLFSAGELSLMIDCHNGTILTSSLAGQQLPITVRDSIELDRMDDKWEVDKADLLRKIDELPIFSRACLEVWASAFWEIEESPDLDGYVSWLSKK